VLICGIRIRGDLKFPNCDGIDLDRCRRARVSDCDIICGDDGISLKSAKEFQDLGPCEDIGESGWHRRMLRLKGMSLA
jgi:polygalacturonase